MYKYNAAKHCIVEQATMKEPYRPHPAPDNWDINAYILIRKEYENHIASLKSYPVQGSVDWVDGQEVEEGKDFEISQTDSCEANCDSDWCKTRGCQNPVNNQYDKYAAYPLQQAGMVDDKEAWKLEYRRMKKEDEFDDKYEVNNLAFIYAFQMGFKASQKLTRKQ